MTQAEFDKQVAQDAQRLTEQGAKRWEEQEAEARRIEWLQVQRQNHYLNMTGQIGIGG
jgi:hypothetical protein